MKISLILPTYNRVNILRTSLGYIARQDYPPDDFEIIVVDNNSTDDTRSVVEDFKIHHPQLFINYVFEKQQGLVYARHTGARSAKYDILSYIDDDGFLNPGWLREVARVFQANDQVAAVAGKIVIKWDSPPPDWIYQYEWLLGKLDYGGDILIRLGLYINGGSFSIKKKVLFELGGFDADQVGEWLIGSGEDELNEKLWRCNYLTAYTPNAVMEHYQLVEKNATEKDIRRRYRNLGVGIPYKIFTIEKKGYAGLIYNFLKRIKGLALDFLKCIILSMRKKKDDVRHTRFIISYDWAQITYSLKIFFDKEFRTRLLTKNEYKLKT